MSLSPPLTPGDEQRCYDYCDTIVVASIHKDADTVLARGFVVPNDLAASIVDRLRSIYPSFRNRSITIEPSNAVDSARITFTRSIVTSAFEYGEQCR